MFIILKKYKIFNKFGYYIGNFKRKTFSIVNTVKCQPNNIAFSFQNIHPSDTHQLLETQFYLNAWFVIYR